MSTHIMEAKEYTHTQLALLQICQQLSELKLPEFIAQAKLLEEKVKPDPVLLRRPANMFSDVKLLAETFLEARNKFAEIQLRTGNVKERFTVHVKREEATP